MFEESWDLSLLIFFYKSLVLLDFYYHNTQTALYSLSFSFFLKQTIYADLNATASLIELSIQMA